MICNFSDSLYVRVGQMLMYDPFSHCIHSTHAMITGVSASASFNYKLTDLLKKHGQYNNKITFFSLKQGLFKFNFIIMSVKM